MTPNKLGMIKLLAHGQVQWLAMEVCSLLAALRIDSPLESININELRELVAEFTFESLQVLVRKGMQLRFVVQSAMETVYVPTGWLCVEQVTRGVLVYGLRASLMLKGFAAHRNYEAMIGLHMLAGSNTDSMQRTLSYMETEEVGS